MSFLLELWQHLDIATGILLLILFLGGWVLWKVQANRDNDFRFEEMLRDDDGKPSAFRLAIFVCLAVSTWVIMYIVLKTNTLDTWMFVTYVAIWSGAKVAETALNAYAGKRSSNYGQNDEEINTSEYQNRRYAPPRRNTTPDGQDE